jgi:TPR repeat protein
MQELSWRGGLVASVLALAYLAFLPGCEQNPTPSSAVSAPVVDIQAIQTKAEAGDAAAQNALGDLLAHGNGVKQNYTQAAKWYRLAAEQGFTPAQVNLAALYAAGAMGQPDPGEAVKWYRLAADKGNADAQYNLAQMLSMGIGGKHDIREALRLYHLAADQGDGLSQYNLARRYREGKDVPADPVQAYFWFTLAIANGVTDAAPMQQALKKEMSRTQIADAEQKVVEFKAKHRN